MQVGLVVSTDMPSPEQQADDELLERAKRLAGQFSDPRLVTLLSALLIADASTGVLDELLKL